MKEFMDKNFVLETKTAELLYHEYAQKMPIIDYHSHLIPEQIANDKQFENITQPWLYGDHYKWRAMRANGIDERYCTGAANDWEKFEKWAETVPYTLRNPLYHWTHLELKSYFGIETLLSPKTAKEIYQKANTLLAQKEFSVQGLMNKMNVEFVCTTDDPIDSLKYHKQIASSNCNIKVLPTWRPDNAMAIEKTKTYNVYIDKLSEVSNINITSFQTLIEALRKRHNFFATMGCKLSDHGITDFHAEEYTETEIKTIFLKVRAGGNLNALEVEKFKSAMLYEFGLLNFEKSWTQQFHYGAQRNNNSRFYNKLGSDTGFDSMGDNKVAANMAKFLDRLDSENKLTKSILYNLNPAHNEMLATMVGNFQDGTIPGKIQWGSAWWFLDQKDGIEKQLNTLSNMGLLSRFIGMLTDSRSFLSFPRHEYFRRILCNLFGNDIENGLIPNDLQLVGSMVEDICYKNAKQYFNF